MAPISELDASRPDEEPPKPPASNEVAGSSDGTETSEPDDATYLSGFKLAIILVCLCLCNFLVALDTTIIATAIPVISQDFHSLQDVGWYGSAYFLTNCAFQLLYGKLYTLFDVKPMFIGAMTIFEIGSLLCAAAPNSPVFILGRAVAGVGGAGTFSGGTFAPVHIFAERY
jgi:MFS family permease